MGAMYSTKPETVQGLQQETGLDAAVLAATLVATCWLPTAVNCATKLTEVI